MCIELKPAWYLDRMAGEGSSSSTRSVFHALKAPTLSDLTRKGSVHCNPPPKGKRRAHGEGSSEPKSITALQQVKEFPEECLKITGAGKSKLFCKACRKELSLKKNIIVSHMSSVKHKTASKEEKERDIVRLLRERDITRPCSWGDSTNGSEGVPSESFEMFFMCCCSHCKDGVFQKALRRDQFPPLRSSAYE